MMESWRKVWREGISPLLSLEELQALKKGLETNDPHLIQRYTITPFPEFMYNGDVESACALAYCGWKGKGLKSVPEVNDYFADMCVNIDARLNETAVSRWFLNWFDDTPRRKMIANLLPEVELALKERL